jgi:hypothetical protein
VESTQWNTQSDQDVALHYSLTSTQGYLWAISNSDVKVWRVSTRPEIERAAAFYKTSVWPVRHSGPFRSCARAPSAADGGVIRMRPLGQRAMSVSTGFKIDVTPVSPTRRVDVGGTADEHTLSRSVAIQAEWYGLTNRAPMRPALAVARLPRCLKAIQVPLHASRASDCRPLVAIPPTTDSVPQSDFRNRGNVGSSRQSRSISGRTLRLEATALIGRSTRRRVRLFSQGELRIAFECAPPHDNESLKRVPKRSLGIKTERSPRR